MKKKRNILCDQIKRKKEISDKHAMQWMIVSIGSGVCRHRKQGEISSRMTVNSKLDV